jgi:glucosamine--fructose-6-phosphate aminotransferase (isomerizing)
VYPTQMSREIAEMPTAAERLATPSARAHSQKVAASLARLNPPALVTVARGSSDHAAAYLAYAAQITLKIPVASVGPSLASIFGVDLRMNGLAAVAISQSGASEDILRLCQSLRSTGGHIVALTNTGQSPLARSADAVIDVAAGPEKAVAATKSFLNSVVAGLWLLADWAEDDSLVTALDLLPKAMRGVASTDATQAAQTALSDARQAVILGRGASLGLAHEIALKLIETCGIHASSYSGAEVLHGPSALLEDGYPVIALTTGAGKGLDQALDRTRAQGAQVVALPAQSGTGHPLVDPLLDLQPLYQMIERLAVARGLDPDNPQHLQKETKTL